MFRTLMLTKGSFYWEGLFSFQRKKYFQKSSKRMEEQKVKKKNME